MADASTASGVSERYASALFDLARKKDAVEAVEKDLDEFEALLGESEELRRLVRSPVFSADEQLNAISAIVDKAGLGGAITGNFLKVVARNRRLFALPGIIRAYRRMSADARGEREAEVRVARELSGDQEAKLRQTLTEIAGRDVALKINVDPAILGGMVVRMGSRQIDTSLRTKLQSLRTNLVRAAS